MATNPTETAMATTTDRTDPGFASKAAAWPLLTLAERDLLRDQALQQALALRTQAIAGFWRDADAWLADLVNHSRRSADRLAARLRQHAKQRARESATLGA
jgi:hypothetical protein